MKRLMLFAVACLAAFAVQAQDYVDLGLPSGTLWRNRNESGFYDYGIATAQFGNSLPTKEQFEELKDKCQWTWTDNGCKVVGPNGAFIVLPADGFRYCDGRVSSVGVYGQYWSSTPAEPEEMELAWYIEFYHADGIQVVGSHMCSGYSVRLVQTVAPTVYVDLGLPSGTLWKDRNEEGFYTFEQSVGKLGGDLPAKEQFEELVSACRWTWNGSGYEVTGPNGNSIVLPAEGFRYCDEDFDVRKGTIGYYMSSALGGPYGVATLYFDSDTEEVGSGDICYGLSVRFVRKK